MAKLLNIQSGKVEEVPDEQVTGLVASGAYALRKGAVDVVNALGEKGTVDASEAARAFSEGMRYRGASEVEAERQRELYGDRPIAAGVAAAARGATLGLSDAVATQTGAVDAETLRGLEDENTAASVVGEVGGTLAATLATAGAATPAALVTRGAARVGAAVAERAGGRAAVRLAVEGAVEGGLQGLGRSITDASQERSPLTAEKVVAMSAEGALFGGALGGAFGKVEDVLAGSGARRAVEGALERPAVAPMPAMPDVSAARGVPRETLEGMPTVGDVLPEGVLAGGPSGQLKSMGGPPPPGVDVTPGGVGGRYASAGGAIPPPPTAPPGAGGGARGGPPGGGGGKADAVADSALSLVQPVKAALEKNPGVVTRVLESMDFRPPSATEWLLRAMDVKTKGAKALMGKDMLESAPRALLNDARIDKLKNGRDLSEFVSLKMEEEGSKVIARAAHLDEIVWARDQLDVDAFVAKARKELVDDLAHGTVDQRATARRLEADLDALLERADYLNPNGTPTVPGVPGDLTPGRRLTFKQGEEFKRALTDSINYDATVPNAHRDAMKKLRGMFNAAQEEAAQKATARLPPRANGTSAFSEWKSAKVEFGKMAELAKIAKDRLDVAHLSNRVFSLTDNIAAAAASAAGGGLNPVGLAMGLGAALLNKWGRENLPIIMARWMRDYENNPSVRRAAKGLWTRFKAAGPPSGAGGERLAGAAGGVPEAVDDAMRLRMSQAAQGGPLETWLQHSLLSGSVEYRGMAEREGFALYNEDTDREGEARARVMERADEQAARFDARVVKATSALLEGKPPRVRAKPLAKTAESARRAVEAARDPDGALQRLAIRLAPVGEMNPGLTSEAREVLQRGQAFLASKAPAKPVGPLGDVPGLRAPWKPSDIELERFSSYLRAVEDPASILDDAAGGRLSRESVEALEAVYPALLEDIRGKVVEQVATHRASIPYAQRLALGQLLGLELDASMSPGFMATIQAMHAGSGQGEPPQRKPPMSASRVAKRIASEFSPADAIANRDA